MARARALASDVETRAAPRSPTTSDELARAILRNLYHSQGRPTELATTNDWNIAVPAGRAP
jgi:hypothetical protein